MRSAITFLNIQLSNSRVSYNKNFNSINMIAPSIFYAMILLVRFPFFTIWSVFMNNQSVMIPLKKYQVLPKSIVLNKYKHKTFEERVAEYNGEISVCDFDWGEPVGKEIL